MEMFRIVGARKLHGDVEIAGAKNAALPIMAACLMTTEPCTLRRVPRVVDVETMSHVLRQLGANVDRTPTDDLEVCVETESHSVAEYDLVRRMRAGICVLGPLLARRGVARVSLPGGCNIGTRPIDLHLSALRAMGARIAIENGYVVAEANRLRGCEINLTGVHGPTVTGTANTLCAAALAEGRTRIIGAAREPEIVDLGNFLSRMGARVQGLGTSEIEVAGVSELHSADHTLIPDRIEAATFLCVAAATRSEIQLRHVVPNHMSAVLEFLAEIGVHIDSRADAISIDATGELQPADVCASPYPGIPTDTQAQMMAVLATIPGHSRVRDTVFPDRLMHIAELNRLGAQIHRQQRSAIIEGIPRLSGARVMASDLRASAALVIAALAADGESEIRRIYHLDRGYQQLEQRLRNLDAKIERVEDRS